jgi:hypothetical protein
MAGKLDKASTYLLRASENEEWELWSVAEGRKAQFVRRTDRPSDTPGRTVIALPAGRTISFPSWVTTDDKAIVPEMMQLQLEQRGLLARNSNGSSLDIRVVETHDNRTLAVATVLQPEFPAELTIEKAVRFEPSFLTLPLPQDRLVLWREQGRLSVAATRGRMPVHSQVLSDRDVTEAAARELRCIVFQLRAQGTCDNLLGASLWGSFTAEEAQLVEDATGLRATRDEVPPPNLPSKNSALLPPAVQNLHARKQRRDRIRRVLVSFLALYALGLLGFAGYLAWENWQVSQLGRVIQAERPTVSAIQRTAERWRRLEWATDPKTYPIELLYQVANLLPGQGMRLVRFESQKGKLMIHGEASTAPAAFKFAADLKASPALKLFQWKMPSPSLRPDGRAEFIIEGEPSLAKID